MSMKYFLRTLKYSRLTNVSLCFSIDLPIAQSGTGDFKRAAVSWCQWPEKSLYEVQSWPSPLYHHSPPLNRSCGHRTLSLLLTVVINLTIDCHHCSATARCVTCELFAAPSHHTHSSHDSRPRTSWKTIISQEDKLGQTIERNSQLIPSQKDTSSCIINHFTTISVFILYLLIVLCITVDRSCTASKRQEIQNKA